MAVAGVGVVVGMLMRVNMRGVRMVMHRYLFYAKAATGSHG